MATRAVRKLKTERNDLAALFMEGVAVDLKVSYWRGQRALKPEDINLSQEQVPEFVSLGRKLLIPRSAIQAFRKYENQAEYYLTHHGFLLPIGGGRFVPNTALDDVLNKLEAIKQEFFQEVTRFLNQYATYQEQMLEKFADYRHALEFAYPSPTAIQGRFGFDYTLFELTMPRKARVKALSAADAHRQAALSQQVKRDLEGRVQTWMQEVASQLRQETVRVVSQVAESIKSGGLHPSSAQGLRQWCDRFEQLNFLKDREVEKALNEVRLQLNSAGVGAINSSESARAALQTSIQSVLDAARDLAGVGSVVEHYRQVDVD